MSTIESAILGVIVAAFLGLGIVILVQHHEIAVAQGHYEQALKNSSALQAENDNWKNVAAAQNAKLAQLALTQKAADAAAAKAGVAATADAQRYAALAAKIAAQKIPADDCAGAVAVKNFYLRNRK